MSPGRARVLAAWAAGWLGVLSGSALTVSGCAWDWSVGAALDDSDATAADGGHGGRADGSASGETGAADAGHGGTRTDGGGSGDDDGSSPPPGTDASVPPDGGAPDAASPHDAGGPEAGPDCAELFAEADASRVSARVCELASGQCTTSVNDPCDCPVFVADTASSAANSFVADVAALKNSSCALGCTTCPTGPVEGICLENADGFACSP